MILGEPDFQTVLDLLEDEGCPVCGEPAGGIEVRGPDKIVLSCGHVVDAKNWFDIISDPII